MISTRFRGFFPIVVDLETTGLDPNIHGVLELGAQTVVEQEDGTFLPGETCHFHILPFEKAEHDPESTAIHKIDPFHPLRLAVSETEAIHEFFSWVRAQKKPTGCHRAVLVGHNAWFDLAFLNALMARTEVKRNPFHRFTSFDTATLCALAYGQTVLAKACEVAKIPYDGKEAHSALYDASVTTLLFCDVLNRWHRMSQIPPTPLL